MTPSKLRLNCLTLNWNWRFRQHMVSLSVANGSRRGLDLALIVVTFVMLVL
jgi:hypothetical protein